MEAPVLLVLPELLEALQAGPCAVLQAPPGAGKTTLVPPALLDEPWLGGGRIILLEPRRVAARAAASWMSAARGERPGETVGFRIRGDSRVGPRTRIEVVTEGILTRMLQDDPALEGVGALLFDEFHERNLQGDLGLALALQSAELLRPELRIVVMSATLESEGVAALLGGAPVISARGRTHPVTVQYRSRAGSGRVEGAAASAVRTALEQDEGDVLVFLPGVGEIRRTAEILLDPPLPAGVDVMPLHGSLPGDVQDRALRPSAPGRRRVVLSTDIAETSVTLDGVRVVIDGGLARIPRFDPRSGMTRLETVPVSRASAEQRAGRAGRTAPGRCHRLWTEGDHAALPERTIPEILDADLAPLALELAVRGVGDPGELRWMDPPPAGAFAAARDLLGALGALAPDGVITAHGRAMASAGVHPRLAHLLLRARDEGVRTAALACDVAALLEERELFRGEGMDDPDLPVRIWAVRGGSDRGRVPGLPGAEIDRGVLHRIRSDAARLRRRFGVPAAGKGRGDPEPDPFEIGRLLLLAYPDRVAMARPGQRGRVLLSGGRGAVLPPGHALGSADFLVAARLMGRGGEDRILLAAPVEPEALREGLGDTIRGVDRIEWDPSAGGVTAVREERLGSLVLRSGGLPDPDPERVLQVLLDGLRATDPGRLHWTAAAGALLGRVAFARSVEPGDWPELTVPGLMDTLEVWLAPWLGGKRTLADVGTLDAERILDGLLPRGGRQRLERLAPTHLEVPSGSVLPLDYSDPLVPVLAVRLQEMFGLPDTPRIGEGRVPVSLHLLSPARRPVQVTRDLASFWRSGYHEVRKELRARYPKHAWPEDPLQASPVRGVPRRR